MDKNSSIRYLKGIGEKRAALFSKLRVFSIYDLLRLYPRDYLDLRAPGGLPPYGDGTPHAVSCIIVGKQAPARIRGGLTLYKLRASDGKEDFTVTFYNTPYAYDRLEIGQETVLYGRVTGNLLKKEMNSPQIFSAANRGLVPVYPLTAGLTQNLVTAAVKAAFAAVDGLPDPLPPELTARHGLPDLYTALRGIHFPADFHQLAAARKRLIYEELFQVRLGLSLLKTEAAACSAPVFHLSCTEEFEAALPFALTGAQRRAIDTIKQDTASGRPMNRLLQGDVGSGKTMVAAAALVLAAKNGFQGALMAPTEILAAQHYEGLSPLFERLGIRCGLLTGSTKAKERTALLKALGDGSLQVLIGTHALLSDDVQFCAPGMAVIDEQHRFGVEQRRRLNEKFGCGHLLVMSATPIPRTLALIFYGDLDISILDELPPGRAELTTHLIPEYKRADMYAFLKRHIDAGEQVYIVCPQIEENEENDLKNVTGYVEALKKTPLRDVPCGILHGKLKPADKDRVMAGFASGETPLLVSTTVIEVGVDVKNATIMVVENAERFGLSALHQLRGRVGRGSRRSYCLLLSENAAALDRLKVLCRSRDGFLIADEDLKQRGPGSFFGTEQHGLPELKLASLVTDMDVVRTVSEDAAELLRRDPALKAHPALRAEVDALWKGGAIL